MLNTDLTEYAPLEPFEKSSEKEKFSLEDLVKTKLKPLPGNITRIMGVLKDVNVTTKKISDLVGLDPILVTRVLRLANSPIYSYQKDITTVERAISAIGIKSLYDIVVLGLAADNFSKDAEFPMSGVSVWEHSLSVAIAAREISNLMQLRGTEEAFTCGLLHDFGITILYQVDAEKCHEIYARESEDEIIELEELVFGFNHKEIGYHISNKWNLPEAVCASILHHHSPREAEQAVVMSHIVNVADDLVTKKGFGMKAVEEGSGELPQSESVIMLRLNEENLETIWKKTETHRKEILNHLH